MSNVIQFQRFKDCKGMSIPAIRKWLKDNGWTNVQFQVRDIDHLVAERLPK